MIFAQITNNIIVNTINLEDESNLNLFETNTATGQPYDSIVRIDLIYPQPGIGWTFDGITFTFPFIEENNNPIPGSIEFYQELVTNAMSFGNTLIIQNAA